ncbi:transcription factor bHLH96-like [Benincasa hispida]|uniref:transcription factor bHLH96-like n=1 Tax=Benincasa hispida TaxID=102211 RepID=UPI0019011FB6|nr:transcription factor bHLH96-like [Benincasa hispida]
MALEAVVFPQDPFVYKDLFNLVNSSSRLNFIHDQDEDFYNLANQSQNSPPLLDQYDYNFNDESRRVELSAVETVVVAGEMQGGGGSGRRRRGRTQKNKEEIENQRMTHITVERNRRKQMNEYLSVLRSLMPHSYVQRGDQASIIGGAINFVKELEQQVHLLSAQTNVINHPFPSHVPPNNNIISSSPFSQSHFFTFPSSSSPSSSSSFSLDDSSSTDIMAFNNSNNLNNLNGLIQPSIGDIEVSLVDSHANLKIRCKKLPKQLLKIVSGLHSLHLTVLHLNVSTSHQFVLYSFSLKVEEDCGLSSGDEIANGVYQLLCRIQEEAFSI